MVNTCLSPNVSSRNLAVVSDLAPKNKVTVSSIPAQRKRAWLFVCGFQLFSWQGRHFLFSLSNLLDLWIQLLRLRNVFSDKDKFVGVLNRLRDLFPPHPKLSQPAQTLGTFPNSLETSVSGLQTVPPESSQRTLRWLPLPVEPVTPRRNQPSKETQMSNELAYISSGASSNLQNSPTHPEGIQMQEGLGVCYVRKGFKDSF